MTENNCGIFHLIIAVVSIDENTTWPQKKQNKIEKGNYTEIEKQHDIQKIDNSLNQPEVTARCKVATRTN